MYKIKIIFWNFCKNINQISWKYIKVTGDFWFYQNLTIIFDIFRHFHSAPYTSVNFQEKTVWDHGTLHNRKIYGADSRVSTLSSSKSISSVSITGLRGWEDVSNYWFSRWRVSPKNKSPHFFAPPRSLRSGGAKKWGLLFFFKKSFFYFNPSLGTLYTSQGQHVVKPSLSPITTPPKSKIFLGRPCVNHQIWLHNIILRIGILKYVKI